MDLDGRGGGKELGGVEVKKTEIGIYSVGKESILNKREKKKTYPKSSIFKKKQILNY